MSTLASNLGTMGMDQYTKTICSQAFMLTQSTFLGFHFGLRFSLVPRLNVSHTYGFTSAIGSVIGTDCNVPIRAWGK